MTIEDAEVQLKVNGKEAREEMEKLEKKAAELREKFDKAFKEGDTRGIREATRELNSVNRQMDNLRTNAANINAAMKRLNEASPRDLQRTIKMINSELNSGRVKRGTKEWDEYVQKLNKVKAQLALVNSEMRETKGLMGSIKERIGGWGVAAASGMAAFAGLAMGGKEAVEAYAEMQQEEANVQKYTGMTADEVARLNSEFKKMDTRTSREDLNKLAQEAGRLGKTSVEDVLGFVKAANQINVALDDLGDGATLTLSKLTGIFGDEERLGTEKSLLAVGSVINELSQNCTASAPYLADFSKRLAGVGAQANMTIPQIMSFAAVLDTQGQAVEMSATAFSTLILKLYKDPAKFAKTAGLDVKKFTELVKKDANEAVLTLLDSLGKMGNIEALAPMFAEMGMDGARASAVLAALAGNIDFVRRQQEAANSAFTEATSITNEYNVQNSTVQAGLDKAKKGFHEMTVQLGEKLQPAMSLSIEGTTLLMRTITTLIDFIIKYKGGVVTLTASIIAYEIALNAAIIKSKAHAVVQGLCKAATIAHTLAVQAHSVAMALLSRDTAKAATAFKAFSATLKASPVGLIAASVTALVGAFATYITMTDKATAKQRMQNSIQKEANSLAAEELSNVKALYRQTQNQNLSMDKRISAINELKAQYPSYFADLSNEAILAGQAETAYNNLTNAILSNAKAKARSSQITKLEEEALELNAKYETEYRIAQQKLIESGAQLWDSGEIAERGRAMEADIVRYNLLQSVYINRLKEIHSLQRTLSDEAADLSVPTTTNNPTVTATGTAPTADDKDAEKKRKKAIKDALEAAKEQNAQLQAENAIAYGKGEKDYEAYTQEKKCLDMELLKSQISALEKIGAVDGEEYANLLLKRIDLEKKYADEAAKTQKKLDDERIKQSLSDIEKQYETQKQACLAMYFDQNSAIYQNEKALKQLLFNLEVEYLKKKMALYEKDSKEYLELMKKCNTLINDDQTSKLEDAIAKRKKFDEDYNTSKLKQYSKKIDEISKLEEEGIITSAEATHAKLKELSSFLAEEGQEFSASIVILTDAIMSAINGIGGNTIDTITTGLGAMSAMFSTYSASMNAARDAELAKIEKRYDTEIEKAGSNSKKVAKLEKQKEAEVAKVKNRYNQKAMKVEIAQALASTAMAAINAYASASKVSWLLGPIAAAMAVGAGMMQVAAIKQQHEAQAAGYYYGGFTSKVGEREVAGVVHGGEFVINHNGVSNPNLLPVLRLIDQAQKNNTVGSLTSADVSNALGQGLGVSARGEVASSSPGNEVGTAVALSASALKTAGDAIDRLNDRLDYPFVGEVVMDGEKGMAKKYKSYQRIINNPKR